MQDGLAYIQCDLKYIYIFCISNIIEGLRERTEHLNIFLFPPITQWHSISDVLFTGRRGVSDFNVLKYY